MLKLVASKVAIEARIPVVGDLCAEAVLPVRGVANDLRPAIRKLYPVFTADDFSVADGIVRIVVAEGVFLHSVIEVEGHTGLMMVMMIVLK